MDTATSNSPRKTGKPPATSTVRPQHRPAAQPGTGAHTVAVSFSAWGPQAAQVRASGGGGRGDSGYVAVTVGDCLIYAYDRDALASHVRAWKRAAEVNRGLRLPERPAPAHLALQAGQDVAVVANAVGAQRHTAIGETEPGGPVLTVVVGAVTIRVHTTTALLSYLGAWNRAEAFAGILDAAEPEPQDEPTSRRGKRGTW